MVEGKWIAPGNDLSLTLPIRKAVLGLDGDEWDKLSWNAVIFSDGIPCATGRIRYDEGDFLLEHLCVLEGYRRKGYGDVLVRLLLFKALQHSARTVRLCYDGTLFPYFEKYGFVKRDEATMTMRGEDICLDNCKACGKCKV